MNFAARGAAHLRALFAAGTPIVGLCAAGILIRAVAPLLADKRAEPPVVAVAEDGSAAVPLLGGHRGANDLGPRHCAALTGGAAAITTAGDLRFGFALDEPPPGWRVANPARVKEVTAALLAGETVALTRRGGRCRLATRSGDIAFVAGAARAIRVTDRAPRRRRGALVLHPPVLALGVGCERGCAPEELQALVADDARSARARRGRRRRSSPRSISRATSRRCMRSPRRSSVPARFFTPANLLGRDGAARRPVRRRVPRGRLLWRRRGRGARRGRARRRAARRAEAKLGAARTCAVARAPRPLDAARRSAGRAAASPIIGIGPGDRRLAHRGGRRGAAARRATSSATASISTCSAPALAGKTRHDGALGAEDGARAPRARSRRGGRDVALVSSGDAGIYGLATLVFELLDREDRADWRRIALTVRPRRLGDAGGGGAARRAAGP